MDAPDLWWSPSLAEKSGDPMGGLVQLPGAPGSWLGFEREPFPADAVPLVPDKSVDEKGRSLRDEVVAILPAVEHLVKTGWVLGTFGRPGHTGADLGEIVKLVIESVDALRAARPTPDHPVHESTLPAELGRADSIERAAGGTHVRPFGPFYKCPPCQQTHPYSLLTELGPADTPGQWQRCQVCGDDWRRTRP